MTCGIEIDFKRIRPLGGGPRDAFEELCCQIFNRYFRSRISDESKYHRFRGAGGDGGVEAIFVLPDGSKLGLQAKYFDRVGSSEFTQMKKSLDAAIQNHPELTRYIFCIPFNPTGPVAKGRRGKSQTQKIKEWTALQIADIESQGLSVEIEYWFESGLQERLLEIDPLGGVRRYWFDREILTREWLQERLTEAKAQAGRRYTPELSVEVPAMELLNAFVEPERWSNNLSKQKRKFKDTTDKWVSTFLERTDISTGETPDHIKENIEQITTELIDIKEQFLALTSDDKDVTNNLDKIAQGIESLAEKITSAEIELLAKLREKHGDNADSAGFRQFQAEYMVSFPAAKLDTARKSISNLRDIESWISGNDTKFRFSRFILLRGVAGIGKTHAIVDHALSRFDCGQICMVFFGEDFLDHEPWQNICAKLGVGSGIGRDELWGMIDAAAEASGQPAVIYIDALNESPNRLRWKQSWLVGLVHQIEKYSNIKLCFSCRDSYLEEVIGERNDWPELVHNGFSGKEHEAIREFFQFYHLQPPTTPLFQSEFSNPLFLHLICQGLQGADLDKLPLGKAGFRYVLRLLTEEKNKRIALICRYDPNDDKVSQALAVLARMMASENTRLLSYSEAKENVDVLFPVDDFSRSLFAALEREGLIAFIFQHTKPLEPIEHFCRFSFERIADFLIAINLLDGLKEDELGQEFEKGKLAFLVQSEESSREHRGVLEALSIIIPESYDGNIELVNIAPKLDRYSILLPLTFSGFQWRDKESFSQTTRELVYEGLSRHESFTSAFDALFGLGLVPNHPCNVELVDDVLNSQRMVERDTFWSHLLYENYETKGAGWRLVDWALHADLTLFEQETCRLWALILSWMCAASDRRVRDTATKGLVRIFAEHPETITSSVERFLSIDDDYILERVSLAAYASLLLSSDRSALNHLAPVILEVLEYDETLQNSSIRDSFRLILELALSKDLLSKSIDPVVFRPPYHSQWPLDIPSTEQVDALMEQKAFSHQMNLGGKGLGSDFQRYVLESRILKKFDLKSVSISDEDIFKWFLISVSTMGYPGVDGRCYEFDRFLLGKYGGGRAKPVWAERLGKKYYWILAKRLQGILSDHVARKSDSWNEGLCTSLPLLQNVNLRDIDPTDLRSYQPENPGYLRWWNPAPYEFSRTTHLNHHDWILQDDFPSISESINCQDGAGVSWVPLNYYNRQNMIVGQMPEDEYPYRDCTTMLNTLLIPVDDLDNVKNSILDKNTPSDISGYTPHDYRVFFGEYPDSLSWVQQLEQQEFNLTFHIPGSESAEVTNYELLRGAEWEYDCSQANAENLLVPGPSIIHFGDLKWDGKSSWMNQEGAQVIEYSGNKGSALLIRKDYLHYFLEKTRQALIFMSYQEKLLITGMAGGDSPGMHEKRSFLLCCGNDIVFSDCFSDVNLR